MLERLAGRLGRARHDGPIDQRVKGEFIAGWIDADRLAGFERGALGEKHGKALQPGLADAVGIGVAGDNESKPRFQRRLERLLIARLCMQPWRGEQDCAEHCEGGGPNLPKPSSTRVGGTTSRTPRPLAPAESTVADPARETIRFSISTNVPDSGRSDQRVSAVTWNSTTRPLPRRCAVTSGVPSP